MKKFILLISLLWIVGCPKHNTMLEVNITSDPEGGSRVDEVSCTFKGRLVNGGKTIRANVSWWWSYGVPESDQR